MTAPADAKTTGSDVTAPAVKLRGLRKRYGSVTALGGLDLDVPEGSVVGLIGPNGAGKTTTMKVIATLLTPDAGQAEVFGHDPTTEPRAVRGIVGWMPDFFGLYEGLTCAEYLSFFGSAFSVPKPTRDARVNDLLELVELTERRDVDVAGLSRGQQQRLALARTLMHDPSLLVLDEPASGLDPRARVDLREIIRELARQGKTVLISSHILAELGELCDRVAIVSDGRVLAQGTPAEINASARRALQVRVGVIGDEAALAAAADAATGAGAARARADGDELRAEVADEEQAADVLAALVSAGVRVKEFTTDTRGLEGLFLSVTDAAAAASAQGPATAAGEWEAGT